MLAVRIGALLSSIGVQVWTNDASARNYGAMVACLMRLDKTGFINAMAWSCTHTRYWGGGSVFVLDGPVSCTSDSFACADNWDGVSGR